MPKKERDANTEAAEMVAKVTGTRKPRASELLPPDLAKKLAGIITEDKKRQAAKKK